MTSRRRKPERAVPRSDFRQGECPTHPFINLLCFISATFSTALRGFGPCFLHICGIHYGVISHYTPHRYGTLYNKHQHRDRDGDHKTIPHSFNSREEDRQIGIEHRTAIGRDIHARIQYIDGRASLAGLITA
jgi:hypothetical protein